MVISRILVLDKILVRNFINDNCIERRPKGSKELPAYNSPGKFYTWQFYLRKLMFNPKLMSIVVDDFYSKFGGRIDEFQIAGVESASTALLYAIISDKRSNNLNAFSIRKEQKPYGLKNWIEGNVNDKPVLLIDDLVSGGHKTFNHAMSVLNWLNIKTIDEVYAVVFKVHLEENNGPYFQYNEKYINVKSLFTLDDFILPYEEYEIKQIKEAHRKRVLDI